MAAKVAGKFETEAYSHLVFQSFSHSTMIQRCYGQRTYPSIHSMVFCITCRLIHVRINRKSAVFPSPALIERYEQCGSKLNHEIDDFSAGAMVARKTSTVNYCRHLEALGSSPRWRVSGLNPQALLSSFLEFFGAKWLREQRNLGGLRTTVNRL